jgi:hypothetical protein
MISRMPGGTRQRERSAAEVASRDDEPRGLLEPHEFEDDGGAPISETIAAVLGSSTRRGEWEPADVTRVFALLGSADLDFTRALLLPGVTEVQAFTLCGSARIVVPEGLEVEVTGSALLGDFKQSTRRRRARRLLRRTLRAARGDLEDDEEYERDDEPPLLRITGLALLGSVRVVTR